MYIRAFESLYLIFPTVSIHYTIASLSSQINVRYCCRISQIVSDDGGVGNECVFVFFSLRERMFGDVGDGIGYIFLAKWSWRL